MLCSKAYWKTEIPGDFETLTKAFFDPAKIIERLTRFILFTTQEDETVKIILRPHQIQAVTMIEERAANPDKKCGLIWHTQGSGKTYTMIAAAQNILTDPGFQNPTILMLVDRAELQGQLSGNLRAVGVETAAIAHNKRQLRDLFKHDTRGLIVSMIHKFDGIPAAVNTRDNIFIFVDEAHRTTGGTLGNYLMAALPNASLIGFTGTPIDRTAQGKGTFITFGKDDAPEGYLHKYSIAQSIADKTTLPLHYAFAPNDLRVDEEILEKEFFSLAEDEEITDIERLNKILERAVTLRNMLKEKGRIEKVTRCVVEHFRDYIKSLGYKAFLAAVDREACALYKMELDKYLPPNAARVVYSSSPGDSDLLKKYHLTDEQEKRIRKDFRKPGSAPDILIVTEKLLTGYDAPILYCLYLDKPMRDHALLQAIARVNRPYEDDDGRVKPAGLVFDFVGVFDKLEKALRFDSHDIAGVIRDIACLSDQFAGLMETGRTLYLPITRGKIRDKAVEALLGYFLDEKRREEFYLFMKELTRLYDILSPDALLRPYIDDYLRLVEYYMMIKEKMDNQVLVGKEFFEKTVRLVQKHTHTSGVEIPREITAIDDALLREIEAHSDIEKVFNLNRLIAVLVENNRHIPYLIHIGEKAAHIVEMFKQRQIDTAAAVAAMEKRIAESRRAILEIKDKDFPPDVFTIYLLMKEAGIADAEAEAESRQLIPVFEKYPSYRTSDHHAMEIRNAVYKPLLRAEIFKKNMDGAVRLVERIMELFKK